ncbi:EAL domain-containing protein [Noviherbaspirillum sp. ST9]|uniref:EAL domain-containing protein n=1 Tax=Noviherbaspirillum sp. ST9 TaxID=3401606 RepID=UPI003B5888E4
MRNECRSLIAAVVGVLSILAPVIGMQHVAREHSTQEQMKRAESIAGDVLRRSDETGAQIGAAIAELKQAVRLDPCSDDMIHRMVRIDVSSSLLQAVGYASGGRIVCSSIGRNADGMLIGKPKLVASRNMELRTDVELASSPGIKLLVATHKPTGFTALVHRDLPIDVFANEPSISVGVISMSAGAFLLGRGPFSKDWIKRLGKHDKASFVTDTHLVSMRRSAEYDLAAYAAIPLSEINADFARTSAILLPLGAIAGGFLALAVFYVARQQMAMPALIKDGLKRNEFYLEYQPVVNLQTGLWAGAEALIRWRRPNGEMIRPDHFIPVAEETGLIERMTRRVIGLARNDAGGFFKRHRDFHIALNLSAADMHSAHTVKLIRELASDTGAGPGNLVVEATERGFMQAETARLIVDELRSDGIRVAIDDFGTGYSNLSYLQNFKLDYLKIDKAFIDTICTDAPTSHVVLHIIELAKDLNIKMIAEGVETEQQARFLREHGVQYAQGWLFGKPMPFDDLASEVRRQALINESAHPERVISLHHGKRHPRAV